MERISLSNHAFEGDNNVYLLDDGPETVLVDAGDRMDATRDQLTAALADHGVGFADVDRLFLTHWHGDHTGLAGEIQAASGATVYVHADDAPLVEGDADAWAEMFERQERYFDAWGMPEEKQAVLLDRRMGADALGELPEVTTFEGGDTFDLGDRELEAVHASGHAKGLCLFAFDANGGREAFSGDALLPVYTPNVGGADVRVEGALAKYLRALSGIVRAGYRQAWPGHRDPIDDPAGRAKHIIHHHEERAWRVLDALRRHGPTDTWTVSAELFGELSGIHILHGPGESHAHLEHLARAGDVVGDDGPVTHYRLADGVAEALAETDGERWPLEY